MSKNELLSYNCPCCRECLPDEPCPVAVRTLEAVAQGLSADAAGMCEWYCPDKDANFCYWSLLDREAPVDDTKQIARLLGFTRQETDKLLASAICKIKSLGPKSELIRNYSADVQACLPPLTHDIYLQLLDPDAHFDPEDVWEDYHSAGDSLDEFAQAGATPPKRRKETVKHETRGFSGAAPLHHSGKRTQLWGLSPKWGDHVREWAKNGEYKPIVTPKFDLKKFTRTKKNDDKSEAETEDNSDT